MLCVWSSVGHPNCRGANVYTKAVVEAWNTLLACPDDASDHS